MIGVYLVGLEGLNYFKIGISIDVDKRIEALQTSLPFQIVLHAYEHTPYALELEQQMHKRLSKYHVRGEWFELPLEEAQRTFKEFMMMARVDEAMGNSSIDIDLVDRVNSDDGQYISVAQQSPTIAQRILALLSDGHPRFAQEISTELDLDGARVCGPLSRMATTGMIARSGSPRNYRYSQRKHETRKQLISRLREMRANGVKRDEARAQLTEEGYAFSNDLWTEAGNNG